MNVTVFYVGSSLLAPLKNAERDIAREYGLDLRVAAYNFGASFPDDQWLEIENELRQSEVVFVIHVMDGENASRLLSLLDARDTALDQKGGAVVVINCMPELMKRTRMGKLDFGRLAGISRKGRKAQGKDATEDEAGKATNLLGSIGSWIGKQARGNGKNNGKGNGHGRVQYLELTNRLPALLRFVPSAGALRDVKNYLTMFCYFLQPTPVNIRSMVLYGLKHYVPDEKLKRIKIPPPETMPAVAIYHPDAASLFESFADYRRWHIARRQKEKVKGQQEEPALDPQSTVGLLLMRPQIVSNTRKHYDGLIRAIEAEGLSVIPAISTLMDNRQACERFFVDRSEARDGRRQKAEGRKQAETDNGQLSTDNRLPRVSQVVSLTGFSFVGGPAMNDSEAAAAYLTGLNIPYRSLVSLDTQTIDSWRESPSGLNPVQTGMQVAIPEIDGATEPFVFGGIPERGVEPAPLEVRCQRVARRLKRWQRLQTTPRSEIKLALVVYCFPPNKGNIGTAADLDVLASIWDVLKSLDRDGYRVRVPESVDALRAMLLGGSAEAAGATANVAYRMNVDEYRQLCPFADDIEVEWGPAPGKINSSGGELLIQGIQLNNIFIGVQPTFGYEGDPMRLLVAKGGAPHHGFAAFYTYMESVFQADAVVHVGTHGAMEFMPGKQVGLSESCWPDRLIGELPNIYIYSVNNPSEGTIAKRRSYAELISYLTPPIENAGLYRGLVSLKELIGGFRRSNDETERERLYQAIEEARKDLNFELS